MTAESNPGSPSIVAGAGARTADLAIRVRTADQSSHTGGAGTAIVREGTEQNDLRARDGPKGASVDQSRRSVLRAASIGLAGSAALLTACETQGSASASAPVHDLHVSHFGATGDPAKDDAPSIQAAVDAAAALPNGRVKLHARHAFGSAVVIPRGVALVGLGARQTILSHLPGYSGWIFQIDDAGRSGQVQAADETYTLEDDHSGVELRDFCINGLDRSTVRNGIRVNRADDLLVDNVTVMFCRGVAMQVGGWEVPDSGSVRESDFRRLRVYKCGDEGVPGLVIQNDPANSGDGTNQLFFHQLRYVYNHSGIVVRNDNPVETLRRVVFNDMQLHGLSHSDIGNVVDHDLMLLHGNVTSVVLVNVMANSSGSGHAVVRTEGSPSAGDPSGLTMTNLNVSNCEGDVLVVDALADLTCSARVSTDTISGQVLRVADGAGLQSFDVRLNGTSNPASKVSIPSSEWGNGTVLYAGQPL